MTDLSRPIDDVRVVPSGERPSPGVARPTTQAEQLRAAILDSAEERLRTARDALVEGVELMTVVMVPQHQHIDRLVAQLIEQVIEHRRVKS